MRLTVTGLGHLGLVHAACMAELGHDVLGLDSDPARVSAAAAGEPWFSEPGLAGLLRRHLATGRLSFTSSPDEAAAFGVVHFLCPGTPGQGDGALDVSQVESAAWSLASSCAARDAPALLVGKSTVPPGTAARLRELVRPLGCDVAWCPEFLAEGSAVDGTLHPSRLVFGTFTDATAGVLRHVHAPLLSGGTPAVWTDPYTAELAKLAANGFLAAKISFFNALAADFPVASHRALSRAVSLDPRIGAYGTAPGPGFGGGCLPKDAAALRGLAGGSAFGDLMETALQVNQMRRDTAVALARKLSSGTACVLGLSFKPGTSDTRDSPGLEIAARLREAGLEVFSHDPLAAADPGQLDDAAEAVRRASVVVVATAHPYYRTLVPPDDRPGAAVDACEGLHRPTWLKAGWDYRALD